MKAEFIKAHRRLRSHKMSQQLFNSLIGDKMDVSPVSKERKEIYQGLNWELYDLMKHTERVLQSFENKLNIK